jgi:methionyl aminopeptidase
MSNKPLSLDEQKKMRRVCQLAARTREYIAPFVKAGVTLLEIDQIIFDHTKTLDCVPATLGYRGYPASCCTSVNEIVCHGVPNDYVLKDGDIVNVDITHKLDGFFGDTSAMFMIGNVSDDAKKIVDIAKRAMEVGIEAITPNGYTGDIGFEINKFATRNGCSTVKEIGGHGIGRVFHTDPFIPSFGKKGKGEKLVPFCCFTVEPMVNLGTDQIEEFPIPGSSHHYYKTKDKKLSAQFEHTILLTDKGYEILTVP